MWFFGIERLWDRAGQKLLSTMVSFLVAFNSVVGQYTPVELWERKCFASMADWKYSSRQKGMNFQYHLQGHTFNWMSSHQVPPLKAQLPSGASLQTKPSRDGTPEDFAYKFLILLYSYKDQSNGQTTIIQPDLQVFSLLSTPCSLSSFSLLVSTF